MSAPVDVLAVMEAESNRRLTNYNAAMRGEAPEALADRLHEELRDMATARAALVELIKAVRSVVEHDGDPRFPEAVLADNRRILSKALARVRGAA